MWNDDVNYIALSLHEPFRYACNTYNCYGEYSGGSRISISNELINKYTSNVQVNNQCVQKSFTEKISRQKEMKKNECAPPPPPKKNSKETKFVSKGHTTPDHACLWIRDC